MSNPLPDRQRSDPAPIIVWLLLGHKAGDNTQVLALADALPWPYETKRFRYRSTELLSNRLLPPNLAGIDKRQSTPLQPPWPQLVITAGRRNEPVARWIRKQSGGDTRLVHLGRPWAPPRTFDLVITTPQYQVPAGPNILQNSLPLHAVSPGRLQAAAAQWRSALASLPRPYVAVLVGGDSGPYVFDPVLGTCLGGEASQMAQSRGGSLLITTSARTPAGVAEALREAIAAPHYFYRWSPDASDNPYFGFLGLADEIIVTGESVSMLTEACATGKPVYILDPARHPLPLHCDGPHRPARRSRNRPWWRQAESYAWKPLTHRLAQVLGPRRMRRDVGVMHRHLVDEGRAAWLGDAAPRKPTLRTEDDLERAAARVRGLFGDEG